MKKVSVDVKELEEFDLFNNCIYYEDLWDDVFGAQEWTCDIEDAVGFIDHVAVYSSVNGNRMSFTPIQTRKDQNLSAERLLDTANGILRSIEFCIARIVCCEDEPKGTIARLGRNDEFCCFEHDDGLIVAIYLARDENEIDVFFYCK